MVISNTVEQHDQQVRRELLQVYLAGNTVSCPSCQSDLSSIQETYCPTCRQELILRVGLEKPNMAAFVVGIIGLASALGFSGMMLVHGIWRYLISEYGGPPTDDMVFILAQVTVIGVCTLLWIRKGRTIRRMEIIKRWLLALVCLVVPIVNTILTVLFIN